MNVFRRRIRDRSDGPTTYIAPGSKLVGKLTGKGAFIFCGTVEGECDIEGPVTVAADGHWSGTLRATDVIIAGTVTGDVIAAEKVEVAGSARITGTLAGNSVAVAEGAVIDGEVKVTSGQQPTRFTEKRQTEAD